MTEKSGISAYTPFLKHGRLADVMERDTFARSDLAAAYARVAGAVA